MSASATRPGILGVWNDRTNDVAQSYEDWYVNQHLPERVGLPGWRFGRRYEAVAGAPRFFTYYELDSAQAMFSDAYLARLNDPTDETREMMRNWRDMTRTSCELVLARGAVCGAFVNVARFYTPPPAGVLEQVASAIWEEAAPAAGLRRAEPLRVQCWQHFEADALATVESATRAAPDRAISAALLVDTMREASAVEMAVRMDEALSASGTTADETGIYRLLCEYRPA